MKRFALVLLLTFAAVCGFLHGQENPLSVKWETDYYIYYSHSADYYGNLYIRYHGFLPSVLTFVNSDGSVTVCTSNASVKITSIYEYNANLREQKTLYLENEFGQLGAFTKDDEGNYYFFYSFKTADKSAENMAMVKYDRNGEKIKTYKLNANAPDSFDGIKIPFEAGTCRLELSGSMLLVYFARQMFGGHQASYGFVLDKDSFERVDRGQVANNKYRLSGNNLIPYVSHSFNQFILPIDGGFALADHGDAYPRCFTFAKFQNETVTKNLNAFKFPGASGANATYAEMGGLAKTSNGYIFLGAYGRERNNPRNLFVLTFDENLTKCSDPIYLTQYKKEDGHAGHPKIVELDTGRYLLLWEFFRFSTQAANLLAGGTTEYLSTYALVIDEQGKAVSDVRELKGIRLNINDTLRYNRQNRKVYWAVNDGNKSITLYALDVDG